MTNSIRRPIRTALSAVGVGSLGLALAGVLPAQAQDDATVDALALRAYPVAIHQGTCETLVTEPSYDLGMLRPRALTVADDRAYNEAAFDDTYTADEFYPDADAGDLNPDTAVLFTDPDADGVVGYGLDLNGNGVLDSNETLQRPILWTSENDLADLEGNVDEGDEAALTDLRDTPHALVVHRGATTDTDFVACGEIDGPIDDNGKLAIAMRPVGQGGLAGIALFEQADGGFLGIGGDGGGADVYMFPTRMMAGEQGAEGTPTS